MSREAKNSAKEMAECRISVEYNEKINCEDGDADDVALDNLAMEVIKARNNGVDKECENKTNQTNYSTNRDESKKSVILAYIHSYSSISVFFFNFNKSFNRSNRTSQHLGSYSLILLNILYTVILSQCMLFLGQASIFCNLVTFFRLQKIHTSTVG